MPTVGWSWGSMLAYMGSPMECLGKTEDQQRHTRPVTDADATVSARRSLSPSAFILPSSFLLNAAASDLPRSPPRRDELRPPTPGRSPRSPSSCPPWCNAPSSAPHWTPWTRPATAVAVQSKDAVRMVLWSGVPLGGPVGRMVG